MKVKKRWLLLILLLLCFSIVYAMLVTNLRIGGSGKLSKNEWNIIFENVEVMDGSVNGEANIVDNTSVSFSADLNKPGDYFEFVIDVSNKGTLDAFVSNYVIGNLGNNSKVVEYDVRYEDGMELSRGDSLLSKESDSLLVRIAYRTDINAEDLNGEEIELNYEFNIDYVQDLGNGINRQTSLNRHLIHDVKSDISTLSFNTQVTGNDNGIYTVNDMYFLRGGEIDNNVVIDNTCYYALLTDTDGNVKLLYNGDYVDGECSGVNDNIGRSVYNSDVNNYDYESSLVRTKVLDWYNNNLSKYDKYIVGGYCNEFRDINKEKYDNGTVDLMCSNIIDDKAALLTINDILFVGHGINGNYKSYLYNRDTYYTMSTYNDDKVIMIDQFGTKGLSSVDMERAIRPVITIKANSPIKQGTGSMYDPYVMDFEV